MALELEFIADAAEIDVDVDDPAVDIPDVEEPQFGVLVIPGEPGPPGPAGDGGFTHTQATPAATWTITNILGRYPVSVSVWIGDIEVETDIETPNINMIVITFASPQFGRAEII